MDNYVMILNNLFLAISLILLILLLKKKRQIKDFTNNWQISNKAYCITLICIFAMGLVIRIWKFGLVPGGFNQDGAMAAVDGLALAKYGTDRFGTWMPAHLYAWGYGQMSSLLSYLIAIFIKLFGLNPIVARLPQLLVSIIGAIFFYLFMKDIFGKKVGMIAAIFVSINPWHFMQSRWALDCNLLPHFFMIGLYFLNRGLSSKKYFIYISMIFFALCMYCYGITIYTIPVFLLAVSVYYFIKKKLTIKDILLSALIYLLIAWPFILTMMVNFFKWDTIKLPFVTISYFSESVRANDILFFSDNILKQLMTNFYAMLNVTLFQKKDLPWNDIINYGTMYYFTMPFVVAGVVGLIKSKLKDGKALVVFAFLTGVWVGLTTNNVNINRINIIYYGMMMFAVIGIYYVINLIKYAKYILSVMYTVILIFFIHTYFTSYADEIGRYFYDGFGAALNKAKSSNAKTIYVTADLHGIGYKNVSEILTLFYDKTDSLYFQGKTNINNGTEYLPYNERFIYKSINSEVIDATRDMDVSYIITKNDKKYFINYDYRIFEYGNYAVVLKNIS